MAYVTVSKDLTKVKSKVALNFMISKGHTYYQSRKLDRVPREVVEGLLGITFPDGQDDYTSCMTMQGVKS